MKHQLFTRCELGKTAPVPTNLVYEYGHTIYTLIIIKGVACPILINVY